MALANYSDLQTSVASWLHRSDLTSIIPDLITLAEAKLNRRLRLRAMENIETGTVAAYVALPTGFLEMRSITASNGNASWALTYIPPSQLSSDTAGPIAYSIIGDNLYFQPASSFYTYSMTYYKGFDAISGGVNWLITNAPDVYLYATLLEASPYLKDDARTQVWSGMLEQSIANLEKADQSDRFGSNLQVKVA